MSAVCGAREVADIVIIMVPITQGHFIMGLVEDLTALAALVLDLVGVHRLAPVEDYELAMAVAASF